MTGKKDETETKDKATKAKSDETPTPVRDRSQAIPPDVLPRYLDERPA